MTKTKGYWLLPIAIILALFLGCNNPKATVATTQPATVLVDLQGAKSELQGAKKAIGVLRDDVGKQDKAYAEIVAKIEKIEGKWYVVWGKRIEAAFYALIALGVVWIIVSILAAFNGWTLLVKNLPLMSFFELIVKPFKRK